ncbi:MAG: hypothetical protein WA294_22635 [Acidobacteriaceae bacterium]
MASATNPVSVLPPERLAAVAGKVRENIGRLLFYAVTFEGALFGSGRLLPIGPVTVRMVLYVLAVIFTIWSLLFLVRLKRSTVLLLVSFAVLLCFGICNGLGHAADLQNLGQDVSPLAAFLLIPFFELTIRTEGDIRTAMRIIVAAASIMAAGYAVIVFSLVMHLVSFVSFYAWIGRVGGDDFIFEGDATFLFYKGSIFIAIAFIFLIFRKGRWAKTGAFVLFLSLFAIGTRGFFLALALCAILYVFIAPLPVVKKLGLGFAVFSVALVLLPWIFSLSGDKAVSNETRLTAMSEVAARVSAGSFFLGHGFGIGVPIRPVHMEIVYLEIVHKQGVLALIWWAILIGMAIARLRRALKAGQGDLAYPLLLAAIFICFESATNPFLNNPIGMYPFLICFVGLGVLADTGRETRPGMRMEEQKA